MIIDRRYYKSETPPDGETFACYSRHYEGH
jgi:hypothetical protein